MSSTGKLIPTIAYIVKVFPRNSTKSIILVKWLFEKKIRLKVLKDTINFFISSVRE